MTHTAGFDISECTQMPPYFSCSAIHIPRITANQIRYCQNFIAMTSWWPNDLWARTEPVPLQFSQCFQPNIWGWMVSLNLASPMDHVAAAHLHSFCFSWSADSTAPLSSTLTSIVHLAFSLLCFYPPQVCKVLSCHGILWFRPTYLRSSLHPQQETVAQNTNKKKQNLFYRVKLICSHFRTTKTTLVLWKAQSDWFLK